MRAFTRFTTIICLGILLFILYQRTQTATSWSDILSLSPQLRSQPDLVLRELHHMTEWTSISIHDEVLLDSIKANGITNRDHLLIKAKGNIKVGVELRAIVESDIDIQGDSITLQLPGPDILDIQVDPTGFFTVLQEGEWPNEAILQLQIKGREKLMRQTIARNMLGRSEIRCRMLVDHYLHMIGFKKVVLL